MAVRLKDIAQDLNLSKMTISKVLRGQTDISAETKARVLKRVEELKYRPNISARSLRTGQTYNIGIIVPSLSDPFIADTIRGVTEIVRPAGYGVALSSADGDYQAQVTEVETQLSRQVDALILCLVGESPDTLVSIAAQHPTLLLIGRASSVSALRSVALREEQVASLAAKHLLAAGCKRIAYLRGPRTGVGDQRFAGFRDALRQAGVTIKPEFVLEGSLHPTQGYRSGYESTRRLVSGKTSPDGIMAYTDLLALGAIDAALETGYQIPRHIQIIGCGNDQMLCSTRVLLTSVDLAGQEIGRKAARMILQILSERAASTVRSVVLSPRIVQRESTRT